MESVLEELNKFIKEGKIDEVSKYIFYKEVEIGKRVVDFLAELKTEQTIKILIESLIIGITYQNASGINEYLQSELDKKLENKYIMDSYLENGEEIEYLNVKGEILEEIEKNLIRLGKYTINFLIETTNELLFTSVFNILEIDYSTSTEYESHTEPLLMCFAEMLGKIGDVKAVRPLVEMIKRKGEFDSDFITILNKFEKNASSILLEELQDKRFRKEDKYKWLKSEGALDYARESILVMLNKESLEFILKNDQEYEEKTRLLAKKRIEEDF
jgi:hypothetical protein